MGSRFIHPSPSSLPLTRLALPALLTLGAVALGGCGLVLDSDPGGSEDASPPPDSSRGDSSRRDSAQLDSGSRDSSGRDSGGRDSSRVDSGACVPVLETCNTLDDDCDGFTDEDFDLSADLSNCGSCGAVCPTTGGVPSCNSGGCDLSCDDGRANCDGNAVTGCEADLTLPGTCGGCDVDCADAGLSLCSPVGGVYVCASDCRPGLTECGGTCADLYTDVSHCGGCGAACFRDPSGSLECLSGTCTIDDCADGQHDCNDDASDGCEARLGTNANCEACGDACASDETCTAAGCARAVLCPSTPVCTSAGFSLGCRLSCGERVLTCDARGTCSCSRGTGIMATSCPAVPSVNGCDPCEQAFAGGCCGAI